MIIQNNTSGFLFITCLLILFSTSININVRNVNFTSNFNSESLVKSLGNISEASAQLVSFNAIIQDKQVLLSWETSSELNNRFFVVEKSTNGSTFSELSKIKSVSSSEVGNEYSIVDSNVPSSMAYYRLSRIDIAGKSSFSEIVSVTNLKSQEGSCIINVDKKPCIGKCAVTFKNCKSGTIPSYNFEMFDFLGNYVNSNVSNKQISNSLEFDTKNYLKPGIFINKSPVSNKNEEKTIDNK